MDTHWAIARIHRIHTFEGVNSEHINDQILYPNRSKQIQTPETPIHTSSSGLHTPINGHPGINKLNVGDALSVVKGTGSVPKDFITITYTHAHTNDC